MEPLFEHSQILEARRKLKGEGVDVRAPLQLDLDLEAHRDFGAPLAEVLGLDEAADPSDASPDLLQEIECVAHRGLARAVATNQERRRLPRDPELEVLEGAEIVDVEAFDHDGVRPCG